MNAALEAKIVTAEYTVKQVPADIAQEILRCGQYRLWIG